MKEQGELETSAVAPGEFSFVLHHPYSGSWRAHSYLDSKSEDYSEVLMLYISTFEESAQLHCIDQDALFCVL